MARQALEVSRAEASRGEETARWPGGMWVFALTLAVAALAMPGCGGSGVAETSPEGAATGADSGALTLVVDEWRVNVTVEPAAIGDISIALEESSGPLESTPSFPWFTHDIEFRNDGDAEARFDDTHTAEFALDAQGEPVLLVADDRCGFGEGDELVEPVCMGSYVPFDVPPGSAVSRTIFVGEGLAGMAPVRAGSYSVEKEVSFTTGDQTWRETVRLVYEMEKAGP